MKWRLGSLFLVCVGLGCGDDGGGAETSGPASTGAATQGSSTAAADSSGGGPGSSSTGEPGTSTGEPGTSTGEPGTSSGGSDTGVQACTDEIEALAPEVTVAEGGCSVVVRLDHDTLTPLGYQVACSPYVDTFLDEQAARDMTDCCSAAGMRLNPPGDDNLWVFHVPPGDFGDVAVVTNHIVQRRFEATIIWDGTGEIGFPTRWQDPSSLGSECGDAEMPTGVSYDLVEGGDVDPATVAAVWEVVGSTALPFAMETVGPLQRVAILRYPRSVGAFNPATAEYVVILEGGV